MTLPSSDSIFGGLRRLILIRHGEAEAYASSDHDRRLTERGKEQLQRAREALCSQLADEMRGPIEVWVSDACRARQTCDELLNPLQDSTQVRVIHKPKLYLANSDALYHCVLEAGALEPPADTLILIGHNPGLSDLLSSLISEWRSLKTGEIVTLQVQGGDWREEERS